MKHLKEFKNYNENLSYFDDDNFDENEFDDMLSYEDESKRFDKDQLEMATYFFLKHFTTEKQLDDYINSIKNGYEDYIDDDSVYDLVKKLNIVKLFPKTETLIDMFIYLIENIDPDDYRLKKYRSKEMNKKYKLMVTATKIDNDKYNL
jgi:hypothetical protein